MSSWIYTHASIMTTSSTSAMRDQKQACNSLEVRREKLGLICDKFILLRVEPRQHATRTETSNSRIQSQSETTGGHADALVVTSKPAKQWTHNTPPSIVARALRLPQDGVSRLRKVFPKSVETHLIDGRVARVQIKTMCWSGLPRRVIGLLFTLLARVGLSEAA